MSAINEMLVKGIAPPTFEEITGAAVVTFRGNVFGPRRETAQVAPQVTPQVASVPEAASSACSFAELQAAAGLKDRVHFLKTHLEPLLFQADSFPLVLNLDTVKGKTLSGVFGQWPPPVAERYKRPYHLKGAKAIKR